MPPHDKHTQRRRSVAVQALAKWGAVEQFRQASEECIELALALRHFERGKVSIVAVCEEIADVENMLEQLRADLYQNHDGMILDRARVAQLDKLERAIEASGIVSLTNVWPVKAPS